MIGADCLCGLPRTEEGTDVDAVWRNIRQAPADRCGLLLPLFVQRAVDQLTLDDLKDILTCFAVPDEEEVGFEVAQGFRKGC